MVKKAPHRTAEPILEVTSGWPGASDSWHHVEDAGLCMHTMFEWIGPCRFLYRNLNDRLSNNRPLETHFQAVLAEKPRGAHQGLSLRMPYLESRQRTHLRDLIHTYNGQNA